MILNHLEIQIFQGKREKLYAIISRERECYHQLCAVKPPSLHINHFQGIRYWYHEKNIAIGIHIAMHVRVLCLLRAQMNSIDVSSCRIWRRMSFVGPGVVTQ